MHVVVWKQHLVPYLQRCLQDLSFGSASVYHVEDWVARTLRDYVRIGRGKNEYQIVDEPDEMVRMKLGFSDPKNGHWTGLTESMLETHLTGRDQGRFNNPAGDEMVAQVQEQVAALENLFQGTPLSPRFSGSVARFVPTVGGIESAIQELRGDLDRLAEEVTEALRRVRQSDRRPFEQMRPVITRARELVTALRERLIDRLTADYAVVLSGFYKSSLVAGALRHRFGDGASERFVRDACGRLAKGRLSKCDRYLLLWLIHILTRGGAGANRGRPLRQYSHTVIDEAQYYHPLVLRLLVDLAKAPLRSVTIVGDLEQRVSNEGGLVGWEEAGIKAEHSKVFRLNTNYRWSKAVFGFLDVYRRLTGLRELKEPRRWASGAGLSPTITHCGSEDDQVEWLIDRVSTLRRTDWSIATVVPSGLGAEWRDRVIAELASCDIRSRWAVGEDVRECEEQVILTDYDSIVGLEFDAVLLPGCERVLPPPKPGKEGVQAAWVALTRARQYVGVGHVAPIAVFDAADFNPYRLHYNRDRT